MEGILKFLFVLYVIATIAVVLTLAAHALSVFESIKRFLADLVLLLWPK